MEGLPSPQPVSPESLVALGAMQHVYETAKQPEPMPPLALPRQPRTTVPGRLIDRMAGDGPALIDRMQRRR